TQAATPGQGSPLGVDRGGQGHNETVMMAAMPQDGQLGRPSRVSVSFLLPAEGATVEPTMLVRGVANGIQEGRHLWLVTHRTQDGGIWPKERIHLSADGTFELQIW